MNVLQKTIVFSVLLVFVKISAGESCPDHRLLIISFDGFRWNYLNRTKTPNFDLFLEKGVHTRRGLKNAFITKTQPDHFTLSTGLWPESHGIVGNKMFDPHLNRSFPSRSDDRRNPEWFDNGGEPIWVTNQLQDSQHRSGAVMWPGSDAPVKDVGCTRHVPYDGTVSNESRVDTVMRWFTSEYPINLGLLYFDYPDHVAHKHGPESEEVTRVIGGLDKVVGYLLQGMKDKNLLNTTNIIITSDHGFSASPPDKVIDLDQYIHPSSYRVFQSNPVANILPNTGMLDEVYRNLSQGATENGHFKVYKKKDIPERFHYKNNDRIMPILVVADDHYQLKHDGSKTSAGEHGWDNENQDMHPFFLAMGPSFKTGASVDIMNSVDIYPLMCHLLCLKPAPNNGSLQSALPLLKNDESNAAIISVSVIIVVSLIVGVILVLLYKRQRHLKLYSYMKDKEVSMMALSNSVEDLQSEPQNEPQRDLNSPLLTDSDEELP